MLSKTSYCLTMVNEQCVLRHKMYGLNFHGCVTLEYHFNESGKTIKTTLNNFFRKKRKSLRRPWSLPSPTVDQYFEKIMIFSSLISDLSSD